MTMKGNVLGPDVMENMAVALNSGFTMDMGIGFGAMSMSVDAVDATGPTKFTLGATDGSLNLALDKERMNYGLGLTGAKLVVSGPEIPFPQVEVGLGEFAFNILLPVSKSDEPQGLCLSDQVCRPHLVRGYLGLVRPPQAPYRVSL
jgi:hypothetical protein